jgi:transcriptional regulator with XRE-family HTH domain
VDARKLGRVIRARREALGLSQEAAAYEAGISACYFADVERGTRSVSVEVAWRIAAALDTKLQSILDAVEHARK